MSVAFGIDVFARRTVGWRVSRSARADCAPGASGQALRQRQPFARGALAHHSDGGSRCVSTRRAERLAEAGLEPSVGSVGGSCDKALAGTVIGLVKAEVIHRRGPSLVRGRRVCHPRTGRLVPEPPPDRADRQHRARRSGNSLLCLAQGQADRPLKLKPNSLQENQRRFSRAAGAGQSVAGSRPQLTAGSAAPMPPTLPGHGRTGHRGPVRGRQRRQQADPARRSATSRSPRVWQNSACALRVQHATAWWSLGRPGCRPASGPRRSSRDTADPDRPSRRAISGTPKPCARHSAISPRSAKQRQRPDGDPDDGDRCDGDIPPASWNQRNLTGCDTPAPIAASSLNKPSAINAQNCRRSSRRATGGRPRDLLAPQNPI